MRGDGRPRFVADTHALLWDLFEPHRLSAAARASLRLAWAGLAELWIPAIVLAEFDFACRKHRFPRVAKDLITQARGSVNLHIAPLGDDLLLTFLELEQPAEMHDRMVAAEALRLAAPVITRDPALRALPFLETIW